MTRFDLRRAERIHFIGIGGVSMSGLAETLHSKGYAVSGSDGKRSEYTDSLEKNGVEVFIGHSASNIPKGVSLVVHSAAIAQDNPELAAAARAGVPIMDRAHLLGLLMRGYARPVCVAGTHGKTSATGMLAEIFLAAGANPAINLGGTLASIGGNYRVGTGSDIFLAEACEYCDSFLQFFPHLGVILNIDEDHLDYFRNLDHIRASFRGFAENISPDGALIINADIPELTRIIRGLPCAVITFGEPGAEYYAVNVAFDADGFASFDACQRGETLFRANLRVRGRHNVSNALAALAAALTLGIDPQSAKAGLEAFVGAHRRFEIKGRLNGVTIVDDYAHHPAEIAATLAAAKNTRHSRLLVVFQPHTYSRTRFLKAELAAAFDLADHVLLLDIYAAREPDTGAVHSRDLLAPMHERGVRADYFNSFANVEKFLLENCVPGDLLITMGAGDVYLVGESLLHTGLSKLSTENGV